MPLYEHVFIARQDASAAQVDGMVEAFSGIVEQGGGRITKKENWGLKTMAYRIKKNRKGHYVLLNIDAPSDAVLELERNQRLHEDVLRYLTIRVDEHEDGPSVMMQGKRDRDSRRAERTRSEPHEHAPARGEQVQEPAPAKSAPSTDKTAPSTDKTAPSTDKTAPSTDKTAPGAEEEADADAKEESKQ